MTLQPAIPASPRRAVADGLSTGALLALGALLVAGTGNRWGVPIFAWFAPVPFLLAARRAHTWRARLALLGVLFVATCAQVGKIVTEPVSPVMALGFAAPGALATWLVLLATEAARRRAGDVAGWLAFPALAALSEWSTYAFSPLGVWGTAAQTQLHDVALLQLASIAGVAGIGFVMALVSSTFALVLGADAPRVHLRRAAAVGALVAAVYTFGGIRMYATQPGRTVTVAAVVTELGLGPDGMPTPAELAVNEDDLFARTELAAARGADIVVWNEVATVVLPDDEPRILARARDAAQRLGVDLVMAYGVMLDDAPLSFDNKYVWFTPAGEALETYQKHHPVPGEPSLRGTAPLVAHDRPWGRAAGAICYDYDFPAMARAHAALGVGLVVVPASDWRGIEPYHSEMARLRAIEGGFAVVRSTRWGASAAYDAYGRARATMSSFEDHDRIMVVTLPVEPVGTIYAVVGDVPVIGTSLALLLAIAILARRRR